MLACAIAALRDARQRGRADGMVVATLVEDIGLRPELVCDLTPAETFLHPLQIHRRIHSSDVEFAHGFSSERRNILRRAMGHPGNGSNKVGDGDGFWDVLLISGSKGVFAVVVPGKCR